MAPEISDLLKRALALPPEARAALASSLLESLDESTVEGSAEQAWEREVAARTADLDSGSVKPLSWPEARRQMLAIIDAQ